MKRIKINDFLKMGEDARRESHDNANIGMKGMWITLLENSGVYTDNQYIVIFDDCVVYKTGRVIDGVQMTDETTAWYEKKGRNYYDDSGNIIGKSVNAACNNHYNN